MSNFLSLNNKRLYLFLHDLIVFYELAVTLLDSHFLKGLQGPFFREPEAAI